MPETTLTPAGPSDAPLLSNLLELYVHDLSAVFPHVTLGEDGRFGYAKLPLYFSEPERRYPFLIRHGDKLAGFALVTRGSPALPDPDVYDIAEFFVLRGLRGQGVGRDAAFRLWRRLAGRWTVRVSEGNTAGLAFWERTVADFAGANVSRLTVAGEPRPWRVFVFDSAAGPSSNPRADTP